MVESFDKIRQLLHEDPTHLAQLITDNNSDLSVNEVLHAMRLLCESEFHTPTYLKQLRSHPNLLISDCASAYLELEGMTDIGKPYTREIPFIKKISSNSELFKSRFELFPRGALSIRSHSYVKECWQRRSSFAPFIKLLKVASARSTERCVFFYTCSYQYLLGLHDLLYLNASHFMQDGLIHLHIIGSEIPDNLLSQFQLLSLPNISITYSDINPEWADRAAYYHAYRYLLLPLLLEFYRLPIMLLGSDTAFAQPAYLLVSDNPNSIGLYFWNPRRRVPWKHIFADVVYFPYTQKGCTFAHAISNYLSRDDWDSGRLLYFDQVAVAFIFNYLSTSLHDAEVNDILPKLKSGICNTNGGGSLQEKLDNGLTWINLKMHKHSREA